MTPDPVTMIESDSVLDAARMMREEDIGDVIVLDDTSARVKGIATDRDVVVRAVAEGLDPAGTTLAAICTQELLTIAPNDPVDKAARFMRDRAVRRLPVVEEDGRPVGVVSIGDLAIELDRRSALAEISLAPANT
jgi:CBS domain-containing protein